MTNIHDIARLSGYSVSTVSRVLNHHNYVSAETRQAIEQVVKKLDYAPNAVARDLSRGKTFNVGVVLPHADHPYFTQLVQGIMRAAFAANYHVVLLPSKWDAQLEQKYLETLRQHAYDALIFTSHGLPLATLAKYQRYGRIVICENPHDSGLPATYAERVATYRTAFAHLKKLGHTHIGVLNSRDLAASATTQATVAAYEDVFQAPLPAKYCYTGVNTLTDGQTAGGYFVARFPEVTAVMTNGDDIALGFRRAYLAAQRPLPYLIGQEHQPSGEALKLPTIDHHFDLVGVRAFQLAIGETATNVAIPSEFLLN
ncbi:LacI family DNA-binding transcriptional regulator [Lactiplantibacillus garii]|uniref:LacI family DNA-binding transcriptional regulator n=1 Tax=Lactiplantibacillus garii TaxID=2306423 RepID=A0A426D7K5_9LACO|nr:LacI family DNA-binding transcriptional regulator [Lactiplantibacillus garii]RRK10566.1 LacI family DNA-binding transcriptional regulator [Lactiplantibacillus garii]